MRRTLEDDDVFSFNLSAFVTAARSVTLLMQVEFAHVPEFCSWYKNKQKSMLSKGDFSFFNEMRVATVHFNCVKPKIKVTIGIFESAENNMSTSTKAVEPFFKEYPKKNIDKRCEKISRYTNVLVDECEELFHNMK